MATDDEALARATQDADDDAARVLGANRAARRAARARLDADEALARRLQREEALGAMFGVADDADDDGARARGAHPLAGFVDDVLGVVRAAVGGTTVETRARARGGAATRDDDDDDDDDDDARRDDATTRARAGGGFTLEIPIGARGETITIDPTAMFGDADADGAFAGMDDAFRRLGAPESILDMLNALGRMRWDGGGGARGGVDADARAAMPTEAYARGVDERENETCSVCLSRLETGETAKRLACKHVYHPACIDRWLERSCLCPVCKRDVCASGR